MKTTESNYISKKVLAKELGRNESTIRRKANSLNLPAHLRPDRVSGQMNTVYFPEAADRIRAAYSTGLSKSVVRKKSGSGYLYVLQAMPDEAPNRIKIGFTDSLLQRLNEHRSTCAACRYLKSWSCHRSWEHAARAWISRVATEQTGPEEFIVTSIEALLDRGNRFFMEMPPLTEDLTDED